MVTLKNGNSIVNINELGAEMKNFIVNGTEYLWVGNPDIWAASAPHLFPMTGGLKDDKYIVDNKEYVLAKHGFAKLMTFEVEEKTENSAVFLLKSNEETMKCFPFEFEFRIIYKLENNKIDVTYKVDNLSNKTMWFSVGAHEGYACPEGIEEYDVIFEKNETLDAYTLFGNLIGDDTYPVIKNSNTLPMKYDYFAVDALVFKDVKSTNCSLINRNTGRGVKVDFKGFPFFIIWTKPDAPYLCLEPWYGVGDNLDSNYDITKKEGIQSIESKQVFSCTHSITAVEGK